LTGSNLSADTTVVSTTRRVRLLIAGIATATVGLRVAAAVLRPAWHDEYFTAWVAALPWRDALAALRVDSGPPLFYALTKALALSGLAPLAAARLLAVVAGSLAVLLAGRAARAAFGPPAGLVCAALLAVHPLALAWSSEGRAYAVLLLAAAWGWERLERLATTGHGARGLAIAVALACWSHAFGLVIAAALAVGALSLATRQRRLALIGIGAGLATNLPWIPVAVRQPAAATAWMTPAWKALPLSDRLLAPVRLLPPLAPFGHHLDLPSAPLAAQLLAALLCVALIAACRPSWRPLALWLVPAFGLTGLAILGVPAFFPGRGEAVFLVPFLGLLGGGAVRRRLATVAAAALVVSGTAAAVVALRDWRDLPPSPEARLAAAVRQYLPDGGTVVVSGYWRLGISHWLGAARPRYALINVPRAAALHPGWYDDASEPTGRSELAGVAARLATSPGRAAVVVSPGLRSALALERLAGQLGLVPAIGVPGARLFVPRQGSPS
jgi:hypothetical protein